VVQPGQRTGLGVTFVLDQRQGRIDPVPSSRPPGEGGVGGGLGPDVGAVDYRQQRARSVAVADSACRTGASATLVLCSAEFELPPADTLAGALDDNYGPPDERDGTDGTARVRRWDYVAPGALGSRILAALTLTGTLQSVESNGTQRFDEVIAVVRASGSGSADSSSGAGWNGDRVAVPRPVRPSGCRGFGRVHR